MAGAPVARIGSSNPQRDSCTTPPRTKAWVDVVSLGNRDRSMRTTSWPARASSSAVAAPAQRAPTIVISASCGEVTWCSTASLVPLVGGGRSVRRHQEARNKRRDAASAPTPNLGLISPGDYVRSKQVSAPGYPAKRRAQRDVSNRDTAAARAVRPLTPSLTYAFCRWRSTVRTLR